MIAKMRRRCQVKNAVLLFGCAEVAHPFGQGFPEQRPKRVRARVAFEVTIEKRDAIGIDRFLEFSVKICPGQVSGAL
jgi:hypothetical protein